MLKNSFCAQERQGDADTTGPRDLGRWCQDAARAPKPPLGEDVSCYVTLGKALSFPTNPVVGRRGGWLRIKAPSHSLVLSYQSNWTSGLFPLVVFWMDPLLPCSRHAYWIPLPVLIVGQVPKTRITFRPQRSPNDRHAQAAGDRVSHTCSKIRGSDAD